MDTPQPSEAPVPLTPAAVVGLSQQVEAMVERLDVMEERRRMDRRIWVTGIGIVVAILLLGVTMIGGTFYNSTQNKEQIRLLRDCTQPGGNCYEDGRQRSVDAITRLIQAQLAIEECGRTTETKEQLEACVELALRDLPPAR